MRIRYLVKLIHNNQSTTIIINEYCYTYCQLMILKEFMEIVTYDISYLIYIILVYQYLGIK